MDHSKNLTSLLAGATAALIAFTALTLALILRSPHFNGMPPIERVWPLLLSSSTSTLLVMSVLQSKLVTLYDCLAAREAKASHDARTDVLTGLGNRKFLTEQLQGLATAPGHAATRSLLFMDLDNFKRVNDTFGHRAGDELIIMVGERLRRTLPDATIARLGGDEFAVLSPVVETDALAAHCGELAETISAIYSIDGSEAYVGVSIGASVCDPALGPDELMRRADIAMYYAKVRHLPYKLFDNAMQLEVDHRILVERKLRAALRERQHLAAHFQPILSRTRDVVALECLLRWNDPDLGEVAAVDAVAAAEAGSLGDALAMFVAQQACEAAVEFPDLLITMNLTASQIMGEQFGDRLGELVRRHGLRPDRFQLEIAELAFVEHADDLRAVLHPLSLAGFNLATDDFGTSSSSLTYLHSARIGTVKFDRSMILNSRQGGTIALMKAKVHLANALGLKVVCEGVSESEDEAIALQSGCDFLQGYYYFRPMPLSQCRDLLSGRKLLRAAQG